MIGIGLFFFFKQKTAYEMRISDWSSDVCSSDLGFKDMMNDRAANDEVSKFVARKIRERVNDPNVADLLIPNDHGFGTRRVPQESGYYEVFNQPNVELVSILGNPIQRITSTGLELADRSFDFDMIVYANGFDANTGAFARIDLRGTGGERLEEKWPQAQS